MATYLGLQGGFILTWGVVAALMFLQVAANDDDERDALSTTSINETTTTSTTFSPTTTTSSVPTTPSSHSDNTVDTSIKCLIIDDSMMKCDCFGMQFDNQTLLKSLNLTDNHILLDRFMADRQKINYLSLTNCTLTEKTRNVTDSMYHLINFDFEDCKDVPKYLYSIMKRRFDRDSTSDENPDLFDDYASSLRIHYTSPNADLSWPSKFALIPASQCLGETKMVKNYNLKSIELINVPNFRDFEVCTYIKFPYIEHLDISYSDMGLQFPNISSWTKLKYLRCRSCQMKNLPLAELLPQNIEKIDFSNNKIVNTNPCVYKSGNQDAYAQNCYLNQNRLGHLDLSSNKVKYFHFDLFKFSHLQVSKTYDPVGGAVYIDINNNDFKTFPFKFFLELDEKRDAGTSVIVNGEHNPLYCNCDMLYVKEAAQAVGKVNFWANCKLPQYLEDRSVMTLTKSSSSYILTHCQDLDFNVEQPHKSAWAVFFEVCIGFVVLGICVLVVYYAYSKFKANRPSNFSTYRQVHMHTDSTTVPYSPTQNEDIFTIDDVALRSPPPVGPNPILAIQ